MVYNGKVFSFKYRYRRVNICFWYFDMVFDPSRIYLQYELHMYTYLCVCCRYVYV